MSTHTPGPWYVRGDQGQLLWCDARHIYAPEASNRCVDAKVSLADARLMAAAPDLLAACTTVLDALEFHYPSMHHSIGVLRSAIAKATGKENYLPVSKEGT